MLSGGRYDRFFHPIMITASITIAIYVMRSLVRWVSARRAWPTSVMHLAKDGKVGLFVETP